MVLEALGADLVLFLEVEEALVLLVLLTSIVLEDLILLTGCLEEGVLLECGLAWSSRGAHGERV